MSRADPYGVFTVNAELKSDPKAARQMSIYLCHRFSGRKLRELGAYFNVRESGISEASRRFGQRLERDECLSKAMQKIQGSLKK